MRKSGSVQAVKSFACERGTKTAYKELKADLEANLPYMPKHYLVDIRKQVAAQFVKRFKRSRIPKYGALNKGFTEQEVGAFFRAIDSPKFHLLFSYQAQMGLRIGEAIRVSLKDIRFETRELVVKTEKAMPLDTLLIPAPLFQETLAYIQANGREIEKASGFLFFKEYGKSRTIEPHLDEGYVRNQFRRFAEAARLDEVYDHHEVIKWKSFQKIIQIKPDVAIGIVGKGDLEPNLERASKYIKVLSSPLYVISLMKRNYKLVQNEYNMV